MKRRSGSVISLRNWPAKLLGKWILIEHRFVEMVDESTYESGERLLALARLAVETFVYEGRIISADPSGDPILEQRSGCFVSIKTDEGNLRGCIGTIEPARDALADEVIANAVSSATRDPRFAPISADELSHLRYSIDVLQQPEPAEFQDLDPAIYGVIVEDESGFRRGLLLPDLQGVDTAGQQVEIAARKAGIEVDKPYKLFRFTVDRYRENPRSDPHNT